MNIFVKAFLVFVSAFVIIYLLMLLSHVVSRFIDDKIINRREENPAILTDKDDREELKEDGDGEKTN